MKHSLQFTLAALLLLLSIACLRQGEGAPVEKESIANPTRIYLVPLRSFPAAIANELASHYREKYGLEIETLPNLNLPPAAFNSERQQVIAERVIAIIKQEHKDLRADRGAILIGLTNEDMYIAKYDWQFSFSYREEKRYAVVSSGRMSLPVDDKPVSDDQVRTRLRKMVTKNIGILFYQHPQNDDPRSVLYRNVGGIAELDNMGEEF